MTTAAEREQAERRAVMASAYFAVFAEGHGPLVLADLKANVAGSPVLRAAGSPTSAEYAHRVGWLQGRKDQVEDIEAMIAEGRSPIERQAQAQETAG